MNFYVSISNISQSSLLEILLNTNSLTVQNQKWSFSIYDLKKDVDVKYLIVIYLILLIATTMMLKDSCHMGYYLQNEMF